MNKTLSRSLLFFLLVTIFNVAAFAAADPTLHQIYQAAQAGKLDEAQAMMDKVLQDHPNSGKAHFVDAELLAKQGRLAKAETELAMAEQLTPGLPFAKPEAIQNLRSRIANAHQARTNGIETPMTPALTPGSSGFPWGLLLLGIGAIVVGTLIFRAIIARRSSYPGANQMGTPSAGVQNAGAGVAPMAPTSGGMGSGIMSGLATGAAVGAGMVAGEALVHHLIDGNRNSSQRVEPLVSNDDNMGGQDFGIADNAGWDDGSGVPESGGGDDWS